MGSNNLYAAVSDAFVSTEKATPISIDLSNNITLSTSTNFNSLSTTTPSNGTAQALNGDPLIRKIVYTPNPNFDNAVDSFDYTVLDINGSAIGTATITVRVGSPAVIAPSNIAQAEITNILDTSCITPADDGFRDICIDYFNATEGERAALANQLAPREIGGQSQLSNTVASQQIDSIRKRLSALRQGLQGGNALQLTYQYQDQPQLSIADLFQKNTRGGAASAIGSPAKRFGVFSSIDLGHGHYSPEADTSEDGYGFHSRGGTVGIDYRLNGVTVFGVAGGKNSSTMQILDNGGGLDSTGYSGILYASHYLSNKSYIEFIRANYINNFKAKRKISYLGVEIDSSGQAKLDGNGDTIKVLKTAVANSETKNSVLSRSLGFGYELLTRRGTTLNLSGNLDYIQSGIDGYQETGAGSANLTIAKRKQTQLTSAINFQFVQAISMRNGVAVLQFDLSWKHQFKDQNNTIEGAFVSDPVNTKFSFDTTTNETDYLNFSAGVQYLIPGGTTGFAHIQLDLFRENYTGGNVAAGIRSEF